MKMGYHFEWYYSILQKDIKVSNSPLCNIWTFEDLKYYGKGSKVFKKWLFWFLQIFRNWFELIWRFKSLFFTKTEKIKGKGFKKKNSRTKPERYFSGPVRAAQPWLSLLYDFFNRLDFLVQVPFFLGLSIYFTLKFMGLEPNPPKQ